MKSYKVKIQFGDIFSNTSISSIMTKPQMLLKVPKSIIEMVENLEQENANCILNIHVNIDFDTYQIQSLNS